MTVDYVVMLIVGGMALLIAFVHSRSISKERDRLKARLAYQKKAYDEAVQLAEQARQDIEGAAAQVEAANRAREQVEYDRDREKRRADEQFHLIEDTVHERDGIWQMYRASVLGAGNAQDLLFTELQRMAQFMRAKAKQHDFEPLGPSEQLQKVMGAFRAEHREEQSARKGAAKAAQGLKDATQERIDAVRR